MNAQRSAPLLWALLGLFVFRVSAQLVQLQWHVSFLPSFEAWHSSTLPYGALLAAQVLIIGFYASVAAGFTRGTVRASVRAGRIWLTAGTLYVAVMLGRLALGLTILSEHRWFGSHLPTFFHVVLASFMIVVGRYHLENSETSR